MSKRLGNFPHCNKASPLELCAVRVFGFEMKGPMACPMDRRKSLDNKVVKCCNFQLFTFLDSVESCI